MNIFSIVLIGLIVVLSLLNKSKEQLFRKIFILAIIIELNVNAGYFIKIGSFELAYNEFIVSVLAIISIWIVLCRPIRKQQFVNSLGLVITICLGFIFLKILPINKGIIDYSVSWTDFFFQGQSKVYATFSLQSIKMFLRVCIFIVIGLASSTIYSKNDWKKDINTVVLISKISIVLGMFEWITKNIFKTDILSRIVNDFFGVGGSTAATLSLRNDNYAIMGFTREPSFYAQVLFFISILLIINIKLNKDNKNWLYSTIILLGLSMSLSSVLFIISILIINNIFFSIRQRKKGFLYTKKLSYMIFLSCLIIIIIALFRKKIIENYYFERIINSIKEIFMTFDRDYTGNVTSEKVRLTSIVETAKVYFYRPFLGIGLGTARCFSSIVSILSNIGLIGSFFWIKFIKSCAIFNTHKNYLSFKVLIIIFIPFLFVGDTSLLYYITFFPIVNGLKLIYSN